MTFFSDLQAALDALSRVVGEDLDGIAVPSAVRRLPDEAVVEVIAQASVLLRGAESLRIAASGTVAERSTRDAGHDGLAQKRGHRSPVSLIQDLTGTRRADAAKQVRLGEALAAGIRDTRDDASGPDTAEPTGGVADAACAAPTSPPTHQRPWHAVLGDGLMTGALTSAQHDAIFRGLGEPPVPVLTTEGAAGPDATPEDATAHELSAQQITNQEFAAAWASAATQLIDEAAVRTVEELASAARCIRDMLDPVGAERRFEERFEARAFRTWIDRDGTRRGSFTFDDEGGAWIQTVIDSALRPRRGGPRFVDPEEKKRADELATDPRTNDQLAYDLVIDVLRAGAVAEADAVFSTRQPGVRIIATAAAHRESLESRPAVAVLEDTDASLPGWLIAQHMCDAGARTATLDAEGNPLDLGREARLYTSKQRLALAVRDGGCRWTGCDRPASYCEAHHIDPYAEGGRTDIDRGILLCRFHHMQLHHGGWRITRRGTDDFLLHAPDGSEPIALPIRLARRYAFGDLQPPPRRFRPAA
ncbi:HNH endonuclease signature motif containing protein [Microbacterium sp. CPCC 204701]|uniref:HNH endonuclease signature motif containing protein n=1 Tax=Microbacterium sp. CPCC 204701 TaxID=2493084 RepID=UPI000FD8354A|nr:HNH endonuclease signature motif containing protein [Microbacterium sp. CPCC 204701]